MTIKCYLQSCTSEEVVPLDCKQFTVGRCPKCNLVLNLLEISDNHSLIEETETQGEWSLTDISDSVGKNIGVFLNNKKLEKRQSHALKNGDIISFGFLFGSHRWVFITRADKDVPDEEIKLTEHVTDEDVPEIKFTDNEEEANFRKVMMKCSSPLEMEELSTLCAPLIDNDEKPTLKKENFENYEMEELRGKLLNLELERNTMFLNYNKIKDFSTDQTQEIEALNDELQCLKCQVNEMSDDVDRKDEIIKDLQEKLVRNETIVKDTKVEIMETNRAKTRISLRENELELELSRYQNQLENKIEVIKKLEEESFNLLTQLSEKEESLTKTNRHFSETEATMRFLEGEAQQLIMDNRRLRKTKDDLELQISLVQQQLDFLEIRLTEKNQSNTKLERALEESNQLIRRLREKNEDDENQIENLEKCLEDSNEIVEQIVEDFTCSICTEPFQRPVALNCSHVFCLDCLNGWRRNHCPICRTQIASKVNVLPIQQVIEKLQSFPIENTIDWLYQTPREGHSSPD